MSRGRRWMASVSLVGALVLAGCAEAPSDEHVIDDPATVEQVEGTDVSRITLTRRAAERLGIETGVVAQEGERLVVPSGAVIVDPEGTFWVYESSAPLTYVRHAIEIDNEENGTAYLSAGPPVGAEIVTVGVPELYGTETGIGH